MKCAKCPTESVNLIRVMGLDLCVSCAHPIIVAMKDRADDLTDLRKRLSEANEELGKLEQIRQSLSVEITKLNAALETTRRDAEDADDQISSQKNAIDKIEDGINCIIAQQAKDGHA